MRNRGIAVFFLLFQTCYTRELTTDGQGSSSSILIFTYILIAIMTIFLNLVMFWISCRQRRRYKVDQSLKRMVYNEQIMPQAFFEPLLDQQGNCKRQPFWSKYCFLPHNVLTQIPCYIIQEETEIPGYVNIFDCLHCKRETKTIYIIQFGKNDRSTCFWIGFCLISFIALIFPFIFYELFRKQIIWKGYFCQQ